MLTTDVIMNNFRKSDHADNRWSFAPLPETVLNTHLYYLSFITQERRFMLSRKQIVPFVPVEDAELLQAFRSILHADEVAACMRATLEQGADPDDIPF